MEESNNDNELKEDLKKLSKHVEKVNEQINKRILLKKLKEKHLDKALLSISEIITIQDEEDKDVIINKRSLKSLQFDEKLEIWLVMINELREMTK